MADEPNYDSLGKPELQEEARRRGLPVSGTKEELIARLVEHDQQTRDDDDPLGLNQPDQSDRPDPGDQTDNDPPGDDPPMAQPDTDQTIDEASTDPAAPARIFRVEYPIPHGLPTQTHLDLVRRAHQDAVAAGHRPRGGATSAARVGYGVDHNGEPTAIYEVSIRRQ